MIQKLYSISQELAREKYSQVLSRIAYKYNEIEDLLIEEFNLKFHDRKRLREITKILVEFKGYGRCLNNFIERVQNGAFRSDNVFEDIFQLCEKNYTICEEIFPNPSQAMSKLVLNVFDSKLKVKFYFVYF